MIFSALPNHENLKFMQLTYYCNHYIRPKILTFLIPEHSFLINYAWSYDLPLLFTFKLRLYIHVLASTIDYVKIPVSKLRTLIDKLYN